MSQVIYDSDFALLTFFKDIRLMELCWKSNSNELEYRSIFLKAVEIAENNKTELFLSDIRNSGAVSLENLQWLKKNIIPKATEVGVIKIGLILNDELFSEIYANSIRNILLKNKIAINFFTNREDALNWLTKN